MELVKIMWSAISSFLPRSHINKAARPHLLSQQKRSSASLRQLNSIQASLRRCSVISMRGTQKDIFDFNLLSYILNGLIDLLHSK